MNNKLDKFAEKSSLNRINFSEKSRTQVMQQISKISRRPSISIWNKRLLSTVTLMFLFLIPVYIAFQSTVEAPDQSAKPPEQASGTQEVTPEKPPFESLENQYKRMIKQDSKQLEVVNYNSKQELAEAFTAIMSQNLATQKADQFFRETNKGLFVKESGALNTVLFNKAYDVDKIDNKKYRLTQTKESELKGSTRLSITYKYQDNKWIIDDRAVEYLNNK